MSLLSKPMGVALLCTSAVLGFEIGWGGAEGAERGKRADSATQADRASIGEQTPVPRDGPRTEETTDRTLASYEGPDPDQPARLWLASHATAFARDGVPGLLEGPRRLARGDALPDPDELRRESRCWIEQGGRLWSAVARGTGAGWGLRSHRVRGWFRMHATSRRDDAELAVVAILNDGLQLPRIDGRIPLLVEPVLAASRGFVPAPLRAEAARGRLIRVVLDPAATLKGRLDPAPARGARLWLELAGGAGALACDLAHDGTFQAFLVPEGFHLLHLDAGDRVLGYYGGIGAPVRAPATDLGVVAVTRSGTLELEVEPITAGPLYLLAYDPGQRPEAAEFTSRRVFSGERVGAGMWRFHGIRTPFAGGFVWSDDGGRAELPALVLGTDGRTLLARAHLAAPRALDLRLEAPGAPSWRGWRVLATPSTLGRADPLWLTRKARKPWLDVRTSDVDSAGKVRLEGLSVGEWWLAALSPRGVTVAKRRVQVAAGGRRVEGGSWRLPGLGELTVTAPACREHRGDYSLRVSLGEGIRPLRKRVSPRTAAQLLMRDLRAGDHEIVVRFEPERIRGPQRLNLGAIADASGRQETLHVTVRAAGRVRVELTCVACLDQGIPEPQAPRSGSVLGARAEPVPTPERHERRR